MVPEIWDNRRGIEFGPIWIRGMVCVYAQLPRIGTFQGSMGPHGELYFFLIMKEQVASNKVLPNPSVSAETLKACALIGLHLLAAEYETGSSACQSPDQGDMRRRGCPKTSN